MRILLDNCVDIHAKTLFPGHAVAHVLDRAWDSLVNGTLLATAAAAGFRALVTVDKNLRYQQNLEQLPLTVIELDVPKRLFQNGSPRDLSRVQTSMAAARSWRAWKCVPQRS